MWGAWLMGVAVAAGGVAVAAGAIAHRTDSERARHAARTALAVTATALVAATVLLGWALVTVDGTLTYVADHTQRATPAHYRLAALWGGLEGSLLLFTAMVAAVAAVGLRRVPARQQGAAVAVAAATATACAATNWWLADPFTTLDVPALDGRGLTPILLHPAMLVHPPLLYLATAATVVPFALTAAAAWTRTLDDTWRRATHRWLLGTWVGLTVAVALGANWAYVELGWGGYWAWDPIENTALIPWLAITAFLHANRRATLAAAARPPAAFNPPTPPSRGLVALALAPFLLVMLGGVLTRSGITVSVHAFGEARAVGRALTAVLVGLVAIAVAAWLTTRRRPARSEPDRRRRGDGFDWLLRAATALALVAALVVVVGTVTPATARLLGGRERSVGGEFYTRLLAPVAVAMVGLAVTATVRAVLEARHHRRPVAWGGHVAHLGLVVLALGVAGSTTATATTAPFRAGDSQDIAGYTVTLEDTTVVELDTGPGVHATFAVHRGDDRVATLGPELNAYPERGTVVAETALRSTLLDDVQVAIQNVSESGTVLAVVAVRPLVMWVWWGAVLVAAGGLLTLWSRRPRATSPVADPLPPDADQVPLDGVDQSDESSPPPDGASQPDGSSPSPPASPVPSAR
jgi:cytochrome c-type biogenesis protein CcmF